MPGGQNIEEWQNSFWEQEINFWNPSVSRYPAADLGQLSETSKEKISKIDQSKVHIIKNG